MDLPLKGKKIAVIVENKFIPQEVDAYRTVFPLLGAEVEFVSRIWYPKHRPDRATFLSDVDPLESQPWESPRQLVVERDVSTVAPQTYAAVIMSANYTSVRLRWEELPTDPSRFDVRAYVKTPPVVRFFAEAMRDPSIIKGALCHGLWMLTPNRELLQGRRVTCHAVVMADILNCGAEVILSPDGVVVDNDLVTGFSRHEVVPFIQAVARQVVALGDRGGAA